MKNKLFTENIKEQLEKIKAYKRSKVTGETYAEALEAIKKEEK
jgi:hypothetical protein